MKKIRYIGEEKFLFGIKELSMQLGFILDEGGYEMSCFCQGKGITIEIKNKTAQVFYARDEDFFRAFSLAAQYIDGDDRHIEVDCIFERFGMMQQASRFVKSIEGIKEIIRQGALMGYNYLELYTEVSYEVQNEPYFGYMKGRYTQQELKEMVAYAKRFFVELVPSIQTLGHLAELFKWSEYHKVKDIERILLVDDNRTYELIENMIKSLAKCYDTKYINLGMDEAYYMGGGRYHWFVDESKPDMSMVYIRHLKKVISIAEKYGFTKPAIWYDNLFEMNYKGYITPPEWLWKDFKKEIVETFPKVRLIFWNYVITDVAAFERYVGYIRQLSPNLSFASMAHGYTSFAPENYLTERLVDTAREGCLRCGINDMMITLWGGYQSPCAFLASYYNYIERCGQAQGYDFEERCRFLFGYTYRELCALDIPNKLEKENKGTGLAEGKNPPFYILAEDLLLGIMEKHIPSNAKALYEEYTTILRELEKKKGRYAYIFRFERILCETLAVKCDLSKRIKEAYDRKNLCELKRLADGLPILIRKLKNFHSAYYEYWHMFNKSMGWEVIDGYLGGAILRLKTVQKILTDYAEGKILKIEELEQNRLPISPNTEGKIVSYRHWQYAATSSI